MNPTDQIVKPGNSEDAQTGLDWFATQTDLVNSRLTGAWQCLGVLGWLCPSWAGLVDVPLQRSIFSMKHKQPPLHLWQWITALSAGANLSQVEIVQALKRLPGITPALCLSPSPLGSTLLKWNENVTNENVSPKEKCISQIGCDIKEKKTQKCSIKAFWRLSYTWQGPCPQLRALGGQSPFTPAENLPLWLGHCLSSHRDLSEPLHKSHISFHPWTN